MQGEMIWLFNIEGMLACSKINLHLQHFSSGNLQVRDELWLTILLGKRDLE